MKAISFVSLLAVVACGGAMSDSERLLETVSRYNDDVRWGRFEQAGARMAPALRREFAAQTRAMRGELQTADYEVVHLQPLRDGGALVRVERSWYLSTEQELRSGSFVQRWQRRGGEWTIVAEQPITD